MDHLSQCAQLALLGLLQRDARQLHLLPHLPLHLIRHAITHVRVRQRPQPRVFRQPPILCRTSTMRGRQRGEASGGGVWGGELV